jgi:hypothetical protein
MDMRRLAVPFLFCVLLCGTPVGDARARTPNRKFDVEGTIAKIVPATDAEKKDGLLATITLKDMDTVIQITKDTDLQRQMGKLVENATADALKEGGHVSVWLKGTPEKTDPPKVKAEGVLIFPGKN